MTKQSKGLRFTQPGFIGQHANEPENEGKEKLELLVGQTLGCALDEIDRVIAELENVRNKLRNEGDRVVRLLINHVALSNTTMSGVKIISDSLKTWQRLSGRSE